MTTGIVLRDGFDAYAGGGAGDGGINNFWNGGCALIAGRLGGQGIRLTSGGSLSLGSINAAMSEPINSFAVGCAIRCPTFVDVVNEPNIAFSRAPAGPLTCGIRVDYDGSLQLLRYNANDSITILDQTPALALQVGPWHFIEWEGEFTTTTTGTMRVYLNGDTVPILSVTEAITSRADVAERFGFYKRSGPMDFDDVYVRNVAERLGQRRIETIRVLGNGAHQDSVPSTGVDRAAMLDELTVNSADYVTFSNVGDYDEYTVTPLSGNAAIIDEVSIVAYAQKTDAATRAMNIGIDSDGLVSNGADVYLASANGRYARNLPLNPNGDINWTRSDVEALLLRPRVAV